MSLKRIRPIIVRKNPPVFKRGDWVFEPRLPGQRVMLYIENGCGYFLSTDGRRQHLFAHMADQIAKELCVQAAIIDGKITTLDPLTGYSPGWHHARVADVYFLAFDLIRLNDQILRSLPLLERKAKLRKLATGKVRIQLSRHASSCDENLLEQLRKLNLQFCIAKRKKDPYYASTRWYRVPNPNYLPPLPKPRP